MTEEKVLDLVHLFLLKKLLCICTVGFCDQASPDLYHVDELKNFVANNLFRLVFLKFRTGIRSIVSHVLGSRASERELSLQNKSDWVLG